MNETRDILVSGWRSILHSYAVANQFLCLELLRFWTESDSGKTWNIVDRGASNGCVEIPHESRLQGRVRADAGIVCQGGQSRRG